MTVGDSPSDSTSVNAEVLRRCSSNGRGLYLLAFGIGLVLRVLLLHGPEGALDGDEAVTGLIARAASHGKFLWIFPGQYYQGTLEGFAAWIVHPILGESPLVLKMITLLCWLGGALLLDRAIVRLGLARGGLAFGLVWCWSAAMIRSSTNARSGYGAGLLLCSFGMYAFVRAASDPGRRGVAWLACSGLAFGAAVWQSPTYLGLGAAFCLGALLVPATRTLARIAAMACSVIVGASPLLLVNALHEWRGLRPPHQRATTYGERLRTVVWQLLPRNLGLRLWHGEWVYGAVVGIVLLLGFVAVMGAGAFRILDTRRKADPAARPFVLAVPVGVVTLASFATSWYVADARYSLSLLLPMAALVATGLGSWWGDRPLRLGVAFLAWVAIAAIVPMARGGDFGDGRPNDRDAMPASDASLLERSVGAAGFRCVMGSYWVVNPLGYESEGRLHTSPAPGRGHRFPEDFRRIDAVPGRWVMVIRRDEKAAGALRRLVSDSSAWRRVVVGPYDLYVPAAPKVAIPGAWC